MNILGIKSFLNRRTFLAGATYFGLGGISAAHAQTRVVSDRLCIGDHPDLHKFTTRQLQDHLNTFRDLGFGTIRFGVGRHGLHPDQDTPELLQRLAFLRQAVATGYKLKLQIGTWSAPPEEVLRQHPEARIRNQRNETPAGFLSPWYPGLKDLLHQQTEAFFSYVVRTGLTPDIAVLIVDLGPAGEPIYPASWVLGKEAPADYSFWFYDKFAQAAFGQDAKFRYSGDIGRANQRWGTDFKTWADVQIPSPKTHPGAMWEDVLMWYRDAKRAIIKFQVATCKALVAEHYRGSLAPQIVLLVPGSHLRPDEMRRAILTGEGDYGIKLMVDSEFILELAHEQGCAVQYTGAENEAEIKYLKEYIRLKAYNVPIWAENAQGLPARNPEHLAKVVTENNLYGLDYINSSSVFESDGLAPNTIMPKLSGACEKLLHFFPTHAVA